MTRTRDPQVKYSVHLHASKCSSCKRRVNVCSNNQGPELWWSIHFTDANLSAKCEMSMQEYK